MSFFTRPRNIVPILLIVFGLLPVAVAIARMGMRFGPEGPDADTVRFFSMPAVVIIHVIAGVVFSLLGALQFAQGLRRHLWHRRAGRVLVAAGLVAALSAIWLNQFIPPNATDGPLLYWIRLTAGLAMLWFLLRGLQAARRQDFSWHRRDMLRAYALGIGVNTQILIGIVHAVSLGPPQPLVADLLVGLGWVINLSVAELAIRRGSV